MKNGIILIISVAYIVLTVLMPTSTVVYAAFLAIGVVICSALVYEQEIKKWILTLNN